MVNKKFKLNSYLIDIYFTIKGNDDSLFDPITETIIKYKSTTDEHSIFISDSAHINELEDKNNFIKNISILHYKVLVEISEFDNLRISLINLLKKYNYIYGINLYHNELPASLDIIDGVYQEIYPSKSYHKDTVYVKFTDMHKNHVSLSQSDISDTKESEHICRINDLILSDPHPDPNVIRLKKMTNIVLYFRSEIENVKFSSSQMIGKIMDILNSYGLNINGNTSSVCIGHNKNCSNIVPIYIIMKHQTNYTQDFFNDVIIDLYNIDISLIGLTVSSDDYSDFLINNDATDIEKDVITGVFAKLA